MLSFRGVALALAGAGMVWAQPALTTIQDILYRADGTRFNGTIFITYDAFQSGDTSSIAHSEPHGADRQRRVECAAGTDHHRLGRGAVQPDLQFAGRQSVHTGVGGARNNFRRM